MNEAIRNILILMITAHSINANAQDSNSLVVTEEDNSSQATIFYGEGMTAPNKKEIFVVEQPDGSGNPLGNPIEDEGNPHSSPSSIPTSNTPAHPSPATNNTPTIDNQKPTDFYNQIYEGTLNGQNRIYDVQSFPAKDIPIIGSTNNPAITSPNRDSY